MLRRYLKYPIHLKRYRSAWFSLLLLSFVITSGYFQSFSYLDAFAYYKLSKPTSEPIPQQINDVVLIQSTALYREHIDIASALASYNIKYALFISDAELSGTLTANNIYYPNQPNSACLTAPNSWHGYLVSYNPSVVACDSLWKLLYPNLQSGNKLVNYRHLSGTLPRFSANRLLSGDVYLAQLEHKVIIVTQQPNKISIEYPIPSAEPIFDPAMLYLYLAFNFENGLFDEQLSSVSYITSTALLVIALLALFQQVSIRKGIVIASGVTLLSILVAWLALSQLHILLPLGNWVFFIWFSCLFVYTTQKIRDESQLLEMIQVIRERMMGRFLPKAFTKQDNPWDSILVLVQQQLDLKRSIFLDRVENDHRVREIRALGCSLEEIVELRRDYEREPYAGAIKALGTVEINRPFFKSLAKNEKQYLVPLTYAGDIRGFWAMTIEPKANFNEAAFIKNVNTFAAQIGELLFHHHVFRLQQQLKQNTFTRTLQLRLGNTLGSDIKLAFNEVEQKLSSLEHVFNHLMNAAVFFNLFGQVVQTNHAMEVLARRFNLTLFDMTALDLLDQMVPSEREVLKGKLRFITLHKGVQFYPVHYNEYTFILKISALESTSTSSSGSPFEIAGIIFEFFDLTEIFYQIDHSEELLNLLIKKLESQNPTTNEGWD